MKNKQTRRRGMKPARARTSTVRRRRTVRTDVVELRDLAPGDLDALREELERSVAPEGAARWNADPADVQRSVARLVLTLMEFLRKLMERQAIRRMEARTLTDAEIEAVGLALMRLEQTLKTMGERFGLTPEELNLDLGPLGRLI